MSNEHDGAALAGKSKDGGHHGLHFLLFEPASPVQQVLQRADDRKMRPLVPKQPAQVIFLSYQIERPRADILKARQIIFGKNAQALGFVNLVWPLSII